MNTDAKKILLTSVVLSKSARKKFFFLQNFSTNQNSKKMQLNYSIFFTLESRNQWTLMLKKFYSPLLNCRNPREKFFFYKNFSTNQNSRKMKFIFLIFFSFGSRDQWTLILKKFYWPLLYCRNSGEKNFFFFSKFFDQSEFEKNEIHLFDFFLVRIERPMNTDTKKILLTFVVMSKFGRKNFFFSSKFFDQSEFEKNEIHLYDFLLVRFQRPMNTDAKKILLTFVVLSKFARKNFFFPQNFSTNQNSRKMKFIYMIFCSFDSRDQWTLMLKKFYWPLLYCRNSREKIFFFKQNFSTNQNSRKMKFIYLIFFSFRSRDQWTLMLKKFYWPLLYCRNSGEKIFFFPQNFSTNQNSRKMKFIYLIFCSFDSRDQWTLILKKFYWPLLYCRNSGEKIFFFPQNFSTNQNWRKNRIPLFDFLLIGIKRSMTTAAKKILLTFVVYSKSARKIILSSKFFDQSEFEKNQIQWFDFLLIGIERPMNTDTKKILLTFAVLSKFGRKNFFFSSKFFDQSEFEKNEIHLFDFLLVRFERPMNTDAKKVHMTFVVLSKFARKNFFFSQNFSPNQNSRKNRIPLFDFLLIGIERPMNTDTKKILLTFVVLSKFARKNFFFSSKFFDQSEFTEKSNSIIRFFARSIRETNEHWC